MNHNIDEYELIKSFVLDASLEASAIIEQYIEEYSKTIVSSPKLCSELLIILDETISNITNYAYPHKTGSIYVFIYIKQTFDSIKVTIIDTGIPFNPEAKQAPEKMSKRHSSVGGYGIFISKKLADEYSYQLKDGKNILTITKKLANE